MNRSVAASARYGLLVLGPVAVVFWLLQTGPVQAPEGAALTTGVVPLPAPEVVAPLPFALDRLVQQLVVILVAARLCGAAARRVGQPSVVGEMFAGLALGPSLLGAIAPTLSAAVFPAGSLGFLNALSQLGVLLFLFAIGLHVDLPALRLQKQTALVASHASIAAPLALGVALAHALYGRLAPPGVPFGAFALFLGVAMSVTAFPVLARILEERRLLHTPLGSLALACAAVDDITAWMLLAIVVAMVKSAGLLLPLAKSVGGTLGFVALMAWAVRPLLRHWLVSRTGATASAPAALSLVLIVALVAGLTTEALGIHALFGAFVAGMIVPREQGVADRTAAQVGDMLAVLLLPLFFAYTGLRTDVQGLVQATDWWALGAILVVAIAGKVGGTAVAARAGGESWQQATTLGVLMNTRGLMELVVLNVGLDLGVLSPALFSLMVIMALVTTTMTVPALSALRWWFARASVTHNA